MNALSHPYVGQSKRQRPVEVSLQYIICNIHFSRQTDLEVHSIMFACKHDFLKKRKHKEKGTYHFQKRYSSVIV